MWGTLNKPQEFRMKRGWGRKERWMLSTSTPLLCLGAICHRNWIFPATAIYTLILLALTSSFLMGNFLAIRRIMQPALCHGMCTFLLFIYGKLGAFLSSDFWLIQASSANHCIFKFKWSSMPCSYGNLPKPHASRRVGSALRENEKMCITSNQGKSRCKVGKGHICCSHCWVMGVQLRTEGKTEPAGKRRWQCWNTGQDWGHQKRPDEQQDCCQGWERRARNQGANPDVGSNYRRLVYTPSRI